MVNSNQSIVSEEFILRETTLDLVNNFYSNGKKFNPESKINYDEINKVQNKEGVYQPKKPIDVVRQNIPTNRNTLIEIKKGSLADQAIKMSQILPNRRNNLPNIFSNKKR
jgi:hypothetical protein